MRYLALLLAAVARVRRAFTHARADSHACSGPVRSGTAWQSAARGHPIG